MAIGDGLNAIDAVIKNPIWDMQRLWAAAADRATQELTPKAGLPPGCAFGIDNPCQTYYGATPTGTSAEIVAWYLSILFAEYTAGMLAQKVSEGHCNTHRVAPNFDPCPDMSAEHMQMLRALGVTGIPLRGQGEERLPGDEASVGV
jgi:hypothetical protein